MSLNLFAAAAATALIFATPALSADLAVTMRLSSAELAKLVAKTTDGLASTPLALGAKGPLVIAAHRTQSGEAEIHDGLNDVFVVHSGQASVRVGGTVEGQRLTTPGEWRGGKITGGQTFELSVGDVLWIPAGQPHQVIVPTGGDFIYMAFKSAN